MKDFSFDFETVAQSPDAVVLSCALIVYDRDKLEDFQTYREKAYYWKFELNHQLERGRIIDLRTLDWWDKQDPEVRKSQFEPTKDDIELGQFITDFKHALIRESVTKGTKGYVRGQSFDFPILGNILLMFKDDSDLDDWSKNQAFYPIPFWDQRDIRSYISGLMVSHDVTKVPLPKGTLNGFKHHDPIDDVARAIMHIKHAELYAADEMDMPEESDMDEFSYK
jgi:hypothetical protein